MQQLTIPDHALLSEWLTEAGIEHHNCGHCQGLHLDQLQAESGILDATLEIEQQVLFFTVLGEVRPARLLPLVGELSSLNNHWPQLKLFVDVNDETLPTMVISHNLPLGAGLTREQFLHFVQTLSRQMRELAQWCSKEGYLLGSEQTEHKEPSQSVPSGSSHALH